LLLRTNSIEGQINRADSKASYVLISQQGMAGNDFE
jgi:hypothetical protein